LIDATIRIDVHPIASIRDTLNYETVGAHARAIIARGHIKLVESLAEDLAHALCTERHVQSVDVQIRKLSALAEAEAAGVRVIIHR
jgi:dihydroneopterin aldolase